MKLTKEWIEECITGYNLTRTASDEIWKAVQEDREEIRKEILADHYKIGEEVLVRPYGNAEEDGVIAFYAKKSMISVSDLSLHGIRRKPSMRQLTRDEKIDRLNGFGLWPKGVSLLVSLADSTIDDLCRAANIPLEVEDE